MTSGSQSAFNTSAPMEVGEDIEEPTGFTETARDFGGGILDFFRGENNEETDDEDSDEDSGIESDKKNNIFTMEDYENQIESDFIKIFGKSKLINEVPDNDINVLENTAILPTEGGNESNIVTIGSEDKQIANNNGDTPTTSNVYVKSTFSDNSKISYIMEYGGGAVV